MDDPTTDPDLEAVEAIFDALDAGEPERALELAHGSRPESDDDPVVRFLAGVALLELDRPEEASEELARAVELDPEDAEFRSTWALALYYGCRFAEAEAEAATALELDARLPDAQFVRALTFERDNRFEEADRLFGKAAAGAPDRFPLPARMDDATFEAHVVEARAWLPEPFRQRLDEVAVTVEPLPTDQILRDTDPPLDPELLGLFVGIPLTEKSSFSAGGELPPRILLFKRNLERTFPDEDELTREIARTLHHELGHYLGLDESELAAIDLD